MLQSLWEPRFWLFLDVVVQWRLILFWPMPGSVFSWLFLPFTGTSVNPARSFGPALLSGGLALQQLWVFIVESLVGAFLTAFVYGALTNDKK